MEKYYRKKVFTCKERSQQIPSKCEPEHIKQVNEFVVSQINRKLVPFFSRCKKKSLQTFTPNLPTENQTVSQLKIVKNKKLSQKPFNLTERKQLDDSHMERYEQLQDKVRKYICEQKAINENREKKKRLRNMKKRNRKMIRSNDQVHVPAANCFGNYFERLKYEMEEKERKKRAENRMKEEIKGKENKTERVDRNTDELSEEFYDGLVEYFYHPSRMKLRQSLGKKLLRRI